MRVHRKILDFDHFELPDQSHFFHNLRVLIDSEKLPLNSLAFNILCTNVRGICLKTDWEDSEFEYNPESGLMENKEERDHPNVDNVSKEKKFCCSDCKDMNQKMQKRVEEVKEGKIFVSFTSEKDQASKVPITAAEGLFFRRFEKNEDMLRLLTSQI